MVEGSELNEAEVYVSIKTPSWYNVGELCQMAPTSTGDNMDGSVHRARVMRCFIVHTLVLSSECLDAKEVDFFV